MAYARHTWVNGEVITEEKLNNIEEGITEAKQINESAGDAAAQVEAHLNGGTNPHGTTKTDVGLGKVENVAVNDMAPTYSDISTLSTIKSGEKLSSVFAKVKLAITKLIEHMATEQNPHGFKTEEWTFTLEDDSTVTKSVVVK